MVDDSHLAPLLIDARTAAKLLGISAKTLWSYSVRRRDIPVVRIGSRTLYDPRDLVAWIDARKADGAASAPDSAPPGDGPSSKRPIATEVVPVGADHRRTAP